MTRVLVAGLVGLLCAGMARADTARVTFVVEVPAATPGGEPIWVSGNVAAIGAWNGAGLRLEPAGERRFAGSVAIEPGTRIEFKVTRGGWETVEKGPAGEEIANRTHVVAGADTVRARVAAWRDQTEGKASPRRTTLSGDIRHHAAFTSRFVRARDVWVYLPPGYAADTTARYPVLYFHDGNNVFDEATSFLGVEWGVDETAERMIASGELPPFIAVAVANTSDRMAEYTPVADGGHGGGRAADYARFLIEELKPFVDATYRTHTDAANTGVVGSSLGGVISLYLGLEHPDVFSMIGCVSPTAWWGNRDLERRARAAGGTRGLRVWVDMGTAEGTQGEGPSRSLTGARALRDGLVASGFTEGSDLRYEEIEGARHDERAWAARVDRILAFLLKGPRPSR